MKQKINTRKGILSVLTVVLLAAAVFTFPYAFDLTWSLPGAEADRTLTYTTGSLTWDSAADIDENGVIRLSMFKPDYSSVNAQNGDNVVAPGTEKNTCIRFLNKAGGTVSYTAVLYRLDTTEVPVTASLSGADAVGTYSLPGGVTADQVIDAVGGTVDGSSVELLDIDWLWQFSVDDDTDRHDTGLGNESVPDEVNYGLYLVVTDNNTGDTVSPKTGDSSKMMLWFVLLVISLCAVVFFLFWGERSEKAQKKHEE